MLDINYDLKYDILYIKFSDMRQSYGDDLDGFVVMRDFASEEITGVTILDFMDRYNQGIIPNFNLPVNIDYDNGGAKIEHSGHTD